MQQHPIPPFSHETALLKVQIAEDAGNSLERLNIIRGISPECEWRSRGDSFQGRAAIEYFLKSMWAVETHQRLGLELWAFTDNRISVRSESEWQHAKTGQWYRSHSNEHWEFDADGYMTYRDMSSNDTPIATEQRRIEHLTNQTISTKRAMK